MCLGANSLVLSHTLVRLFCLLPLGYFVFSSTLGVVTVINASMKLFSGSGAHEVISVAANTASVTADSGGLLAVRDIVPPEENARALQELGKQQSARHVVVMVGTVIFSFMLTRQALSGTTV